jgi:hypothetical protein
MPESGSCAPLHWALSVTSDSEVAVICVGAIGAVVSLATARATPCVETVAGSAVGVGLPASFGETGCGSFDAVPAGSPTRGAAACAVLADEARGVARAPLEPMQSAVALASAARSARFRTPILVTVATTVSQHDNQGGRRL